MDTQGVKNWGYPGNAKKAGKKTYEKRIKRQNQHINIQNNQKNKAAHNCPHFSPQVTCFLRHIYRAPAQYYVG